MDDLRVGALVRAVRHRLRWTQAKVAARAGVSQRAVSRVETGRIDEMAVRHVRAVAAALEIRIEVAAHWRGGDGVRLLDSSHAALVDLVVTLLRRRGWKTMLEYTFNEYGERGSVDVVGWRAGAGAMLVLEIKSRLQDVQDTIARLDRKGRIVPRLLARERGWQIRQVGIVLVLDDLTANRSAIARHAASFDAAYPHRGLEVRRWMANPSGRLAGIWFVSHSRGATTTRRLTARRRVRTLGSRSGPAGKRT